jgi:uncharacterized protein YbjT (DUF2867 family)
MQAIEGLIVDVFGTLVDWRGGVAQEAREHCVIVCASRQAANGVKENS